MDGLRGAEQHRADGDTITVLDAAHSQNKIRLHQIDAPEKKQDFGQRSKQSLSELVYRKSVKVDVADIDKYGRTVGKIWLGPIDINLEQVKRGMAWVYEKYAEEPAYFAAERTAKNARIGLWNKPSPTPPWIFRHPERAGSSMKEPSPLPRQINPTDAVVKNDSARRCAIAQMLDIFSRSGASRNLTVTAMAHPMSLTASIIQQGRHGTSRT